jgi:hypothetical protein
MKCGNIIQLEVMCNEGNYTNFIVGTKTNSRVVGSIRDKSLEYENGISHIYQVIDNEDNLIVEVINASVLVYYDKPI